MNPSDDGVCEVVRIHEDECDSAAAMLGYQCNESYMQRYETLDFEVAVVVSGVERRKLVPKLCLLFDSIAMISWV